MIVTYLRSSSIGSWDWCQHQTFLNYTLGMKTPSNIKAEKGNIVHKVLECLAHKKKCEQDGKTEFDGEDLGIIRVTDCDIVPLLDRVFAHSTKNADHVAWSKKDYEECLKWINQALNYKNGLFDPRNAQIREPEKRFDLEIPHHWSNFDFDLPNGKKIDGKLSIKGTMDLIVDIDSSTIEIVDYKTGRRLDWSSGQEKTFKKLNNDKQLMLYFYAAYLLYPEIEHIIVSIFYINDGGAYTLSFTKRDIPRIEEMIKSVFNDMKNTLIPRQDISWKCNKICGYNKPFKNSNKSICDYMHNEIIKKGISKVTEEYSNGESYKQYGSGGGRQEKGGTNT